MKLWYVVYITIGLTVYTFLILSVIRVYEQLSLALNLALK